MALFLSIRNRCLRGEKDLIKTGNADHFSQEKFKRTALSILQLIHEKNVSKRAEFASECLLETNK